MNPLLTVRNLSVSFSTREGRLEALRGIHFEVKKGEIVGLIGESGSGKSVTAHSLLQLLPENTLQMQGEIWFEGINLLKQTAKEMQKIRGKKISMIFQDPSSSLNPTLTIETQLLEGLYQHEKISKAEAKERALHLLQRVGINEPKIRLKQYPHELSGGMRQRVMIAMAIACQPLLLIADEPTTALDVTVQAQILDLLKDIQTEQRMSLLLITHDLGVVARLCDHVLVIYGGQIVESASVTSFFSNPQHPYSQALLKSKWSLNGSPEEKLFSIRGVYETHSSQNKGCAFTPRCPYAMNICQQKAPAWSTVNQTHHLACWLSQKNQKEKKPHDS